MPPPASGRICAWESHGFAESTQVNRDQEGQMLSASLGGSLRHHAFAPITVVRITYHLSPGIARKRIGELANDYSTV